MNPISKSAFTRHGWSVPVAVILLWHLPYFLLGANARLTVFDNLDSVVVWYKLLLDKKMIFAPSDMEVPGIMQGLLRGSLPGYDLALLVFGIFGMVYGYALLKLIISLTAYCGMYLLQNRIMKGSDGNGFVISTTALLYALLPFWSVTLSVAGLPLLFVAFYDLYNKKNLARSYFTILFFGFGSSLVLIGIFIFIIGGLFWITDVIRKRKIPVHVTAGFMLLGVTYVISHLPGIINTFINAQYVSHRTEMISGGAGMTETIKAMLSVGLFGQDHAESLHTIFLLPVVIIMTDMLRRKVLPNYLLLCIAFIILTSALYGILLWENVTPLKQKLMAVFPVQLQRFHLFHPLIWYLLLGAAGVFISQRYKNGRLLFVLLAGVQFLYLFTNHELWINRKNPTLSEFFSLEAFRKMTSDFPEIKEGHCLSIGLHPSVAQYNELNTLDGYFADYPLKYKHSFREIIAPELSKNESLRKYYDEWGSRCYGFSAEIGTQIPLHRSESKTIHRLNLNYNALRKSGGTHIISGFLIEESGSNLLLLGKFGREPSPLYLYRINN